MQEKYTDGAPEMASPAKHGFHGATQEAMAMPFRRKFSPMDFM